LASKQQQIGFQTTKHWLPNNNELASKQQQIGFQTTTNWLPNNNNKLASKQQRIGFQTTTKRTNDCFVCKRFKIILRRTKKYSSSSFYFSHHLANKQ